MKRVLKNYRIKYPGKLCTIMLAAAFIMACSTDERKKKPDNLIPVNTLVQIFVETSLADGIINTLNIRDEFVAGDSLRVYADIVEKFGFTMEEMDKSMQYYFFSRQKQLIMAYDRALAIVSEMQARHLSNPAEVPHSEGDLWNKDRVIHLPLHNGDDSAEFAIPVNPPGYYSIVFTVKLAPYDQSKDPGFSAWTCSPDSLLTGKKTYIEKLRYFRDGAPHTYSVTGFIDGQTPLILGGTFYSNEADIDENSKSVSITVDSFSFTRQAL